MNYVSLFSGIEAASVAWKPLGWRALAFSEIEPFPCAVLAHHYPDVPNLGDVSEITSDQIAALGRIDIVVGGSPCQDLSVAGKRAGLAGARSSLFHHQMRIFHAARSFCGARFCLWENVPGAFSSNSGRDFAVVVGSMAGCEFGVPKNGWKNSGVAVGENGLVEWRVLDAQHFGVPQRRRRVFALLDTGDWRSRPPVLFERESLSGHPAPGRETREGVTPILEVGARTNGDGCRDGDGIGQPGDPMYTLQAGKHHGVAAPLTASYGKQVDSSDTSKGPPNLITHSLRADGFDASEDGTGRGTPLVPMAFSCKDHAADHGHIAPSLRAMGHDASHANAGGQVAVAFQSKASASNSMNPSDIAPAMDVGKSDGLAVAFAGKDKTLYPVGIRQQENRHAGSQETHAVALLRVLRQEVGEEAFAEWGLGILDSLQPKEILRQALHGSSLRSAAFTRSWVVASALGSKIHGSGWLLQSLREAECARCTSQGWEPPEQLARELGAYLSELSQPGPQAERFMCDLWQASEGIGILRQALSAVQEIRRPATYQRQSARSGPQGIGASPDQNMLNRGVRGETPRERVLRETSATVETRQVGDHARVRRLTVTECEFLQGFPRGYTDITYRGRPAADGPKYKALGNSFAVPVVRWIGERIAKVSDVEGQETKGENPAPV